MHLPRTERRATSRQARASTLLANISQVMEEEYNYDGIRNIAVASFAHHYDSNLGNDRGACVAMAARGLADRKVYSLRLQVGHGLRGKRKLLLRVQVGDQYQNTDEALRC